MKRHDRRRPRKLVLTRQTLRRLTGPQLTGVAGGGTYMGCDRDTTEVATAWSCTCPDTACRQTRTIGCG